MIFSSHLQAHPIRTIRNVPIHREDFPFSLSNNNKVYSVVAHKDTFTEEDRYSQKKLLDNNEAIFLFLNPNRNQIKAFLN